MRYEVTLIPKSVKYIVARHNTQGSTEAIIIGYYILQEGFA